MIDAPTSRPPFDAPQTVSWSRVVQPSAISFSRRSAEVVEHVLLALPHARPVPLLAFLAAAAQAGDRVDAARLDPGENRAEKAGVRLTLKPPYP